MDPVIYARNLIAFYNECVGLGFVRVIRNSSDLITIWSGDYASLKHNTDEERLPINDIINYNTPRFTHYIEPIALSLRTYNWISPTLAIKNIDTLNNMIRDSANYLVTMDLSSNKIKFKLYDVNMNVYKKYSIRLFTFRFGRKVTCKIV